jgi:hypothetical protein
MADLEKLRAKAKRVQTVINDALGSATAVDRREIGAPVAWLAVSCTDVEMSLLGGETMTAIVFGASPFTNLSDWLTDKLETAGLSDVLVEVIEE